MEISFRDPTQRGLTELDVGVMGTHSVRPGVPYRFSFGDATRVFRTIFCECHGFHDSCLWCGWAGAQQRGFGWGPNVCGVPKV